LDAKKEPMSLIDTGSNRQWAGLDSNQRRLTSMGLQPISEDSQEHDNKEVTQPPCSSLQTSLQTNPENDPKQADSLPPELMKIVEAWPDLPNNIKAAVMVLVDSQ
jgi:hypothetical protein